MDELEFALESINGNTFEGLAMAFLREEGYHVHESGDLGADGGWDARIEIGSKHGIAHASKQKSDVKNFVMTQPKSKNLKRKNRKTTIY